jgi:hypothetical protein
MINKRENKNKIKPCFEALLYTVLVLSLALMSAFTASLFFSLSDAAGVSFVFCTVAIITYFLFKEVIKERDNSND